MIYNDNIKIILVIIHVELWNESWMWNQPYPVGYLGLRGNWEYCTTNFLLINVKYDLILILLLI